MTNGYQGPGIYDRLSPEFAAPVKVTGLDDKGWVQFIYMSHHRPHECRSFNRSFFDKTFVKRRLTPKDKYINTDY